MDLFVWRKTSRVDFNCKVQLILMMQSAVMKMEMNVFFPSSSSTDITSIPNISQRLPDGHDAEFRTRALKVPHGQTFESLQTAKRLPPCHHDMHLNGLPPWHAPQWICFQLYIYIGKVQRTIHPDFCIWQMCDEKLVGRSSTYRSAT